MKLTVTIDDTLVTISDPTTPHSPDVLDDWCRRAGELLMRAIAIRATCLDEDA